MTQEKIENKNRKKYEKEFFKCGECKFNGDKIEIVNHVNTKEHYEEAKSLGIREYVPTIEEAQNCGDVIFEEGVWWHKLCGEFLETKKKTDKKGNTISIDFVCKKCGQRFEEQI